MNRFYIDKELCVGELLTLTETVFHHWCRVLRAKLHEQAIFFNGLGGEYTVELIQIEKKSATVQILSFFPDDRTLAFQVTLGQVMSKGDRMDYAIQKATELGVHQIQLLTSERCEMRLKYERDQKKIEHWQAVAIAACEQCGMNRIPQILPPRSLEQWTQECQASLKLVMTLTKQEPIIPQPRPAQIAVLVGPEGGLTQQEITHAQENGFQAWTIGSRVLRTETAPIVALTLLAAI